MAGSTGHVLYSLADMLEWNSPWIELSSNSAELIPIHSVNCPASRIDLSVGAHIPGSQSLSFPHGVHRVLISGSSLFHVGDSVVEPSGEP